MNTNLVIAVTFVAVYALRISGLSLPADKLPPRIERTLRFVPIALLSALAATSLANQSSTDPMRLLAASGAVLIAFLTGRMWACILGGFVLYWVIRIGTAS